MQQTIQQPATHCLLRQSQRRRQSLSHMQSKPSPINNHPQKANNSKYHYNYSRSSNPSSHKKGISSSLYESKYLSKHKLSPNPVLNSDSNNVSLDVNMRRSMIVPSTQQKIVVCQSLPKTRPKYSFTFSNLPPNQPFITHPITTITPNTSNNPQPIPQTPRATLSHPQPPSSQRPSYRSPDIRKDMDLCLYAISDKLKQLQCQQQQTKQFIESKFNKNVEQSSYRPSISQIRKNKKMYLDRSIHRIHPEIVNEYIETVYREYDIPDPLKGRSSRREQGNVREITGFEVRDEREQNDKREEQLVNNNETNRQIKPNKQLLINKPQTTISSAHKPQSTNNQQKPIAIQPQPLNTHQLLQKPIRQQYYLHNSKFPSHHRKNNLISSSHQQQHQQKSKKRKKKFLGLTLSKQKPINPKTFNSPNIQAHKQVARHENSSRSQSNKSRHSSSQKKILEIKKNIATWNDNQHQYAERYSYIESPYEVIRQEKRSQLPSGNIEQNNDQINIRIKPFQQLMKATFPTQTNEHYSTKGHNTTQHSQFLQSKYVQSFFTQQGEVIEEFRFCILCELPVLSANISKHEEKCIGWIDGRGKFVNFKDLYGMEKEHELKQVIKGKIKEIKKRMVGKITQLKEKEKQDPEQKIKLTTNIMHSVENLVQTFIMMAEFDTPHNSSMFSSGYKKIQQNYKSQYILLLQESKKLHWFVKLLENYERRLEKMNTTNVGVKNEKGFTSTKAKHNQSLTFIQQEESQNNQVVSEFGSQREQI